MKPAIYQLPLVAALLTGACVTAPAHGPHIRVATATTLELEGAANQDNVWYEFQPGDVVPVYFGFIGAVEGGTKKPGLLRAKKLFFLVTSKNHPIRLSFDGKTFAGDSSNQAVLAILPRKQGKGGQLIWMMYMGEDGNAESAMDELLEASE